MNGERLSYLILLIAAVGVGVAAYLFGAPLILGNDKAMDVIVTLFSILAGFIIAIMTLLGDETLRPGGWKRARVDADNVKRRLDRQQQLFWLYLTTLTLILGARLIQTAYPAVSNELQRIAFGMAAAALLLSYALPVALRGAQVARLEAAVGKERKGASTLDRN